MTDLEQQRAARWWYARRRVASIARAKAFIDDVGFALLFPASSSVGPSLWAACADRSVEEFFEEGWGPDMERVWGWKDELPRQGLAWYGKLIKGRGTFLSLDMLRDLYPRAGRADDFAEASLSRDAREIARVLLPSGPTSAAALREATGLIGKRNAATFARAVVELGKALVITHHGVEEQGAGWPSAVYELTARAFDVRSKATLEERCARAAARFVSTMIETTPVVLARTFGWASPDARAALDTAVERGAAAKQGKVYRSVR